MCKYYLTNFFKMCLGMRPKKKSFAEALASMPNVGKDSDFQWRT